MSKARRMSDLRRRSRLSPPAQTRLIECEADLLADPGILEAGMPGWVTYLTDPVFGGMQAVTGISPGGRLITDDSDTIEQIPVVLFEPARTVISHNPTTGLAQEIRTEAIVACGFHRMPPGGRVWAVQPAPGWEVRRRPGELVLRDGSGDIWAASPITPDPRWVSAAVSYRDIIVCFGPRLGIRVPPGTSPAAYTTTARAAEFRQARECGLISVATVTWRGEATAEAMEWVTFLPGSFGQRLPGIFAPAWTFTRHGGPGMFGLTPVSGHDTEVTMTPALTVRVTRTDIDLLDPAEAPHSLIAGVHYDKGLNPAWARAARRQRLALLITGPRLPGARTGQNEFIGPDDELRAALVQVTFI